MVVAERPYALLAELTYRCPLHCPYCSNPVRVTSSNELDTVQWKRVIQEAAVLGVLQIGFSGGEPLQRKDLESLVRSARDNGLYTNLITSGLGLTQSRARQLAESGLDNIQLSFQAVEGELADRIAGVRNAHEQKLRAADLIQGSGIALSLNVVVHRFNIDRVEQIIDFAEKLGATRLELANTQYYGWAFQNRSFLIPTPDQVETRCASRFDGPQTIGGYHGGIVRLTRLFYRSAKAMYERLGPNVYNGQSEWVRSSMPHNWGNSGPTF